MKKGVAVISALISLASYAYKTVLGVLSASLMMIAAALPTLFIFIAKLSLAKNMDADISRKRKAYLTMTIATICFTVVFIIFAIMNMNGIAIGKQNKYTGLLAFIFIGFIIVMFVLSVVKLKGAFEKGDILTIGLREITFLSALGDTVLIEGFLYMVFEKQLMNTAFYTVHTYFGLIIGGVMVLVSLSMLFRYLRLKSRY